MGEKSSGSRQAQRPPAAFSPAGQFYLQNNPDVANAQLDPWAHYNEYGKSEGRLWGIPDQAANADYLNRYPDVAAAGVDPFEHYQTFGAQEGRTYSNPASNPQTLLDQYQESQLAQAEAVRQQQEDAMRQLEAQREEDRVAFGENQRDNFYNDYLDAVGAATDYVNSSIESEKANADLLGIEYNITEEGKSERINDYFSTLWSDGDQSRLQSLFDEFGEVEGFSGFTVTRGEGNTSQQNVPKPGQNARASSGLSRTRQGARAGKSLATSGNSSNFGSLSTLGG